MNGKEKMDALKLKITKLWILFILQTRLDLKAYFAFWRETPLVIFSVFD